MGSAVSLGTNGEGIKDLLPQKLAQARRNAKFPQAGKAGAKVDLGIEGPLHEVCPFVSYRGDPVISNRAGKGVSDQKSGEGREQQAAQDRGDVNPARRRVEKIEAQREPGLPAVLSIEIGHLVKSVPNVGFYPGESKGGRVSTELVE